MVEYLDLVTRIRFDSYLPSHADVLRDCVKSRKEHPRQGLTPVGSILGFCSEPPVSLTDSSWSSSPLVWFAHSLIGQWASQTCKRCPGRVHLKMHVSQYFLKIFLAVFFFSFKCEASSPKKWHKTVSQDKKCSLHLSYLKHFHEEK